MRTGLDSSDDVEADPETSNPGSTAPEPDNDDYQNASGSYTFQNTTRIRNSLGTSSGYTGINYDAGQSVNYDRVYRNVDGYDWLSYISYGGQRRYVAMTNSGSSQSNNNQNYESTSGTYRFNNTTRIRNGLGTSAPYSGRNYSAGQTVHYDRVYRNVDGYDWLSYMSYSGQRRYVAMTNSGSQSYGTQQNRSGAYTFRNTTKIRNGVGVNAAYTGRNYSAGQTVYYDRVYRNVNGYDWLSYMSYSGQRHYVAMTN
ncbi:SH3 domain-containing protein [Tetragenococcus halophilus]